MKLTKLCAKKGVAGLNVYLSLIAMLFMIGIILMVFQIAGTKLASSNYDSTSVAVVNESITPKTAGTNLTNVAQRNAACGTAVCKNATGIQSSLAGNFTQSNCAIANVTAITEFSAYRCSYTYTYDADNLATQTINDTQSSLTDATDFFPTFVTLGAMVVLILLVVIIINSIRATGVTNEGA